MDTFKSFTDDLMKRIRGKIESGDVKMVNEIAANIMVGTAMFIIMVLMIVCLVLNEVGVFTVDKTQMRIAVILSLLIQAPICGMNSICRGEKRGLKNWLLIGILLMCAIMTTTLGHNVAIMIVFPMVLSVRYYDDRITAWVAGLTTFIMIAGGLASVRFGIANLNVVTLDEGTSVVVSGKLRDAIVTDGFDYAGYMKDYIVGDLLPRILQFSVVAIACSQIVIRGKRLIEIQAEVTGKASRLETELNLATEIQASVLPCMFPAFPDHAQLDIYARNIPAKEVGGDFYDYFRIDDDHVGLVIADVSGKGVGAALFMMVSKVIIKNQLQSGRSVAEAITKANAQLCENNEAGLFVTVWACVFETTTGIMRYVNAGHNPPVLCRNSGDCAFLAERSGLVLAVLDDVVYKEYSIRMEVGESLLLYTDGVTEATNRDNKLYGSGRLLEYVRRSVDLDARETLDGLLADVDDFVKDTPQFDDITILTMKVS